jgi:hypothetical protein
MHYSKSVKAINQGLDQTNKIIVSIGCSFVFGSAAFSQELLDSSPPVYSNGATWTLNNYSVIERKKILEKFPGLIMSNHDYSYIEFDKMFVENSFTSILCRDFLKKEYTPINFGSPGAGLKSSIMKLFLVPVEWKKADEIIVVFCPTSANRLDILIDENSHDNYYRTAWPSYANHETISWNKLQEGFSQELYSEKWEALNFLTNYQLLTSWVKNHNAKLITFPAFNDYYNPDYFYKMSKTRIIRDQKKQILDIREDSQPDRYHQFLFDSVDWNSFIAPQGKSNFFTLALSQEDNYDPSLNHLSICGEHGGSETKWIMNCGHPSSKAHRLLAQEIYHHLEKTDYCRKTWNIWQ